MAGYCFSLAAILVGKSETLNCALHFRHQLVWKVAPTLEHNTEDGQKGAVDDW